MFLNDKMFKNKKDVLNHSLKFLYDQIKLCAKIKCNCSLDGCFLSCFTKNPICCGVWKYSIHIILNIFFKTVIFKHEIL